MKSSSHQGEDEAKGQKKKKGKIQTEPLNSSSSSISAIPNSFLDNLSSDDVDACVVTSTGSNGNTYVFEIGNAGRRNDSSTLDVNADNRIVAHFPNQNHQGYPHNSLCYLPSQHVLLGSPYHDKCCIHVLDLRRKKQLFVCSQSEKITCITASHDVNNTYCFGGSENGIVYIWHVSTGKLVKILNAHSTGSITAMCCTPDSSFLITGGKDSVIHVWNLADVLDVRYEAERNIDAVFSFQSHSLAITSITCSVGSHTKIISSSLDGSCIIWDLSTGSELCSIQYFTGIHCAAISPNEHVLYAGSANGKIYQTRLYPSIASFDQSNIDYNANNDHHVEMVQQTNYPSLRSQNPSHVFKGHTAAITDLSISLDGLTIASASKDGSVKLWDTHSKQLIFTFMKHTGASLQEYTNVQIIKLSKLRLSTFDASENTKTYIVDEKTGNFLSKKNIHQLIPGIEPLKKFTSSSTKDSFTESLSLKQQPGIVQIAQVNDMWEDITAATDLDLALQLLNPSHITRDISQAQHMIMPLEVIKKGTKRMMPESRTSVDPNHDASNDDHALQNGGLGDDESNIEVLASEHSLCHDGNVSKEVETNQETSGPSVKVVRIPTPNLRKNKKRKH